MADERELAGIEATDEAMDVSGLSEGSMNDTTGSVTDDTSEGFTTASITEEKGVSTLSMTEEGASRATTEVMAEERDATDGLTSKGRGATTEFVQTALPTSSIIVSSA